MNGNERFDAILKQIDQIEDDDKLEGEDERYFRPRPPKEPSQVYSIRVPVERLEQLRRLAAQRHVAPSALIREWVLERLDAETGRPSVFSAEHDGVRTTIAVDDIDSERVRQIVERLLKALTDISAGKAKPSAPVKKVAARKRAPG